MVLYVKTTSPPETSLPLKELKSFFIKVLPYTKETKITKFFIQLRKGTNNLIKQFVLNSILFDISTCS